MASEPEARSSEPARISAHHLAETVRAGHNGANDALDNHPAAHATALSQAELALMARVREHFTEIVQRASSRLNTLQAALMGRRAAFADETYEARIRSTGAAMRALLTRNGGDLAQRVQDGLRAKREYAFFQYTHRRNADPKIDKWQFTLFFLVVPLVVESLLNGNFFADSNDLGLIGGTATAVIISALNVALGFIMGLGPARYCQHVKRSHLFWALPTYAAMIVLIVLFNFAVGHYRELLIANRDAQTAEVVPRMMANLFGVYDLKSIALVIIGCIVAFISASKGFSAFGAYPGHARAYKHWRQRADAVDEERRRLDADLQPELETLRAQTRAFREECKTEIGRLQTAKAEADQARDLYFNQLAQLRSAKDAALAQYREANLKVRTDAPPAYFSQSVNLPEIDHPAELPEHRAVKTLIADFEQQLANMPALIEAKLKDQLALVHGLDLASEIEKLKTDAIEKGRLAFEQDETLRKQAHADFAAAR